jgi:hypothetical protein
MAGQTSSAQACATCFGQSDSPLAAGMNMGILTLLFIVGGVLVGVAAFMVFLLRRAAKAAALEAASHPAAQELVPRLDLPAEPAPETAATACATAWARPSARRIPPPSGRLDKP